MTDTIQEEQAVQSELTAKFPALGGAIRIQRSRRIFARIPHEQFHDCFDYLVKDMKFNILTVITGTDEGESLGVMYHLSRESRIVLSLFTTVPKQNPVIQTVTPYFPAADAYERELVDLLGFQVQGLPPGFRYPLTDDWPAGQYPLRKDWKPSPAAPPTQAEKNEVKDV